MFLCAYMVLLHPHAVMSSTEDPSCERLSAAARSLVTAFESLVRSLLALKKSTQPPNSESAAASDVVTSSAATPEKQPAGSVSDSDGSSSSSGGCGAGSPGAGGSAPSPAAAVGPSGSSAGPRFSSLLLSFDAAWVDYLHCFVAWKVSGGCRLRRVTVRPLELPSS